MKPGAVGDGIEHGGVEAAQTGGGEAQGGGIAGVAAADGVAGSVAQFGEFLSQNTHGLLRTSEGPQPVEVAAEGRIVDALTHGVEGRILQNDAGDALGPLRRQGGGHHCPERMTIDEDTLLGNDVQESDGVLQIIDDPIGATARRVAVAAEIVLVQLVVLTERAGDRGEGRGTASDSVQKKNGGFRFHRLKDSRYTVGLMRLVCLMLLAAVAVAAPPKKIVIIAGRKSHPPGFHEYVKSAQLLKVMLERATKDARVELHFNGWPENPATLDTANTIIYLSDGQDGDLYNPVPFMTPERMPVIERQMKRGCGLGLIHFSTFAPDQFGPQILAWTGGYFDWQDDTGARKWYSAIKTLETRVEPATPDHPALRGLAAFDYKEEFYYQIRFPENRTGWKPLMRVPALGGTAESQVVGWSVERADGGRGFGTSMGHFFANWRLPSYRKYFLNLIAWSAGVEIPAKGLEADFVEETSRLLVPNPVKTLLLTGDDHPAHLWKQTTVSLLEDLNNRGPEFDVRVTEDPNDLAHLDGYQLLVLHYANWTSPGLSEAAKAGLVRYLERGGGLVVIHFANGAFHHSLPKSPGTDWPGYREMVARVWDHTQKTVGHDKYGKFRVDVKPHALTRGLESFETTDELYFGQVGTREVEVLATARSQQTGQDEPMAMIYRYGKGRVFQTVLGHSLEAQRSYGTTQLIRRGASWAAGRN